MFKKSKMNKFVPLSLLNQYIRVMKNIFLFCCMGLLLASCAHDENDLSKAKLKGKIRSIRLSLFEITEKDGTPIQKKINENYTRYNAWGNLEDETSYVSDMIQRKSIYINNIEGQKIELSVYDKNGLEYRFQYFYGRNGKLSYMDDYDKDSVFRRRMLYRYDRSDNMTGQYWIMPDSSVFSSFIYKSNARGKPIKITQYSKDQKETTQYLKYDKKNNVTEAKMYNAEDSLIAVVRYVYDKQNNLTELHSDYDLIKGSASENMRGSLRGNETFYYDYLYDDKLNILQKRSFDSEKKPVSMEKYRYDEMNNWITLEFYSPDEKLIRVLERQIEYYEE